MAIYMFMTYLVGTCVKIRFPLKNISVFALMTNQNFLLTHSLFPSASTMLCQTSEEYCKNKRTYCIVLSRNLWNLHSFTAFYTRATCFLPATDRALFFPFTLVAFCAISIDSLDFFRKFKPFLGGIDITTFSFFS